MYDAPIPLETVLDQIRQNWAYVVWPRADRLELSDTKWDDALSIAFPSYTIWNLGDNFNYSKCHTYAILLHPGRLSEPRSYAEAVGLVERLGGCEVILLLKLSAVVPYYLITLLARIVNDHGTLVEQYIAPTTHKQIEALRQASAWAENQGFVAIPEEYLAVVVPGAELELAEPGKVTVYNCLFEDEATLDA